MKTVLVTGCSSGYGLETARHFLERGWRVIATMRTPREDLLPRSDRLRVLALDVTSAASIAAAVESSGPIDVLVNNAGIGGIGPLEAMPMSVVREMFETNMLGVIAMTKAVLPQFRARRSGVVVNVTSSVTLATMPLVAVYAATKTAIEGFTASLALELESVGVRARLVEPGYAPTTAFTRNAEPRMQGSAPEAYAPFTQQVLGEFAKGGSLVTTEADVAEAVYRAANDTSGQLRFPAGADAIALARAAGIRTHAEPKRARPTSSPVSTLHLVDPAAREFVASAGVFDPERDSLDVFRKQLLASYAQLAPPMPYAREEQRIAGPTAVRVLLYRPQQGPPPSRAILYVHGGGFIAGAADMTDATCVRLANEHRALVVSVDYRLAPESPFPGPVEECYTALSWLLKEAPALGIDRSRVILMGHSAGGGLAAATGLVHRDRGGAPLAGQVLVYPMLDARTGTDDAPVDNPSTGEFGWTRAINRFAWKSMRGNASIPTEREGHYSPSLASDLSNLPPTFLAVGSVDLFFEEDIAFGLGLSRAGVPVEMHVYPGGIHGFDFFPGGTTDRFSAELNGAVARLLG